MSARGRGVITDRGSQIPSHLHIPITIFLSDAKMKLGLRHDVVLYRGAIIQRRGTGRGGDRGGHRTGNLIPLSLQLASEIDRASNKVISFGLI